MTTKSKKGFASRCKACDRVLETFTRSRTLPDGSFDDLCTHCKEWTKNAYSINYRDHTLEHVEDPPEDINEYY